MTSYRPVSQHLYNKDPNFRFTDLKGSGSFGYVFKAIDLNTNTEVAIKRSQKVGNLVSREFEILQEVNGCDQCVRLLDIFYTVADQRFI
jgi:glycogen synthase kinase 3 beta